LSHELSLRRKSHELELCSEHIALALEDDAPAKGPRASFLVDIQNPCWIYKDAALDRVNGIVAAVGQVPFNFQIGADMNKIRFPKPATPEGELEVRIGSCEGELAARVPLAPATRSQAVTVLAKAAMASRPGRHDLCLRFAQPTLEPMWTLDWIELGEKSGS
jgi:hexosaminidase